MGLMMAAYTVMISMIPILFPLNILNISERERTEKIIPVIREMKRKISRNIMRGKRIGKESEPMRGTRGSRTVPISEIDDSRH